MDGRGDLTDEEWEWLRPLLPEVGRRGGRWRDHRQVIDGVLFRIRTGTQWRDLPERFGPWKTVHERHRRWSADGTWERLLRAIQTKADAAGGIDWDVSVDSSTVRAHPHAAGARRPAAAPGPKGGPESDRAGRDGAAGPGRPPGGGGAEGEQLGRSRGGFTTKVHLCADGRCRLLSLVPTPGHWGDSPQFEAVLEGVRVPRVGPGRPRTRPDSVSADKAYSSRDNRRHLRRRKIRHTIPEPDDQIANRRRRGSAGGRPTGFDEERYKKRNVVERAIGRLKQFRGVATRYDKRGYVFHGTVIFAALIIWLRT
ncbi:IS5 family transposase [Embleya sp. NPDC001921]